MQALGRTPMPWQQLVLDVAYELDDAGDLYYDEVDVGVGRQVGKSLLKLTGATHRLTKMAGELGPQRATYTMQTRTKARTKLEREYAPILRSSPMLREVTHPRQAPKALTDWKLSMNNGTEHARFGPGSYWQIDAPDRAGGHGDTLDRADIDEAFAHQDDTIEEGLTPSMATRRSAQLWVYSAAGDAKSRYWYRKLLAGRTAVAAGSIGRTAFFDWSAPPDADPGDPATWWACIPALGITITERFIESQYLKALAGGQEKLDQFCRAYLSMWPEVPILADEVSFPVVPADDWDTCENPESIPRRRVAYVLDADTNTKGELWFSIGASDGTHLELIDVPGGNQPGDAWVVPALKERRHLVGELVIDPAGPAGSLIEELRRAGVKVRELKPSEVADASEWLLRQVAGWAVSHLGQPRLTAAAAGAQKRDVLDGRWRFSRTKSLADIGPLLAVGFAGWAATSTGVAAKPAAANTAGADTDEVLRPRDRLTRGDRLGR